MNRDSNLYTFLFAAVMVLVVATVLAFTSQSLKDLQNENVRKEKNAKYFIYSWNNN
jgi:Na+-transporting NADH:ubiquinone oxidoreductase subunit C